MMQSVEILRLLNPKATLHHDEARPFHQRRRGGGLVVVPKPRIAASGLMPRVASGLTAWGTTRARDLRILPNIVTIIILRDHMPIYWIVFLYGHGLSPVVLPQ